MSDRIRFKRPIDFDTKEGSDLKAVQNASIVIDRSGCVVKDRDGRAPRQATQEEIESCEVIN